MSRFRKLSSLAAGVVAAIAMGAARADTFATQAVGGSGLPGAPVYTQFTFDPGSYNLVSFDFAVTYNPASLVLDLAHAQITAAGNTVGLQAALNDLATASSGDFVPTLTITPDGLGGETLSVSAYFQLGQLPVSGPLTLKTAFTLVPGATPGSSFDVVFAGTASQFVNGNYTLDDYGATAVVTVTAVPEPGAWLMLAAGVAMLLGMRRRAVMPA